MARSLLLVHSPLVGPSSWGPVAATARERGWTVAVPDLTGVATCRDSWGTWFVDRAVEGGHSASEFIVAGHSGAGVFLPQIADRFAGRCVGTVFVDAVVPPASGSHETSAGLAALLDEQTEQGLLRPWLDWWPDEVVARLLPETTDRAQLRADMPRLPRVFYDEPVDVPVGWTDRPNAYLQLSPAYDADRRLAEQWGWPTAVVDGTHLGIVTEPEVVVDAIAGVVDRMVR